MVRGVQGFGITHYLFLDLFYTVLLVDSFIWKSVLVFVLMLRKPAFLWPVSTFLTVDRFSRYVYLSRGPFDISPWPVLDMPCIKILLFELLYLCVMLLKSRHSKPYCGWLPNGISHIRLLSSTRGIFKCLYGISLFILVACVTFSDILFSLSYCLSHCSQKSSKCLHTTSRYQVPTQCLIISLSSRVRNSLFHTLWEKS